MQVMVPASSMSSLKQLKTPLTKASPNFGVRFWLAKKENISDLNSHYNALKSKLDNLEKEMASLSAKRADVNTVYCERLSEVMSADLKSKTAIETAIKKLSLTIEHLDVALYCLGLEKKNTQKALTRIEDRLVKQMTRQMDKGLKLILDA